MSVPLVRQGTRSPLSVRLPPEPAPSPSAARQPPTARPALDLERRHVPPLSKGAGRSAGATLTALARWVDGHPKAIGRAIGALTGTLGLLVLANGVKEGRANFAVDPTSGKVLVRPEGFGIEAQHIAETFSRRVEDGPPLLRRLQHVADRLQRQVRLPAEVLRLGLERLGPATLLHRADDPGLPAALGAAILLETLPEGAQRFKAVTDTSLALEDYGDGAHAPQAWRLALARLVDHDWPQSTADLALPLMEASLPPPGRTGTADWGSQAVTWGSRALATAYLDELGARLLPAARPEARRLAVESLANLGRLSNSTTDPQARHDIALLGLAAHRAARTAPEAVALLHSELTALAGDPYSPASAAPVKTEALRAVLTRLLHQDSPEPAVITTLAAGEVAWPSTTDGDQATSTQDQRVARYRHLALDTVVTPGAAREMARDLQSVWDQPTLTDVGGPTSHLQEILAGTNRQLQALNQRWGLPLPLLFAAPRGGEGPARALPAVASAGSSPVRQTGDDARPAPVQVPPSMAPSPQPDGSADDPEHLDASHLLALKLEPALPPRDPPRRARP